MNKIYLIVFLLIIILFINNNDKQNRQKYLNDQIINDSPLVNGVELTESGIVPDQKNVKKDYSIFSGLLDEFFSIFRKVVPDDIIPTVTESNIKVLKDPNVTVDYTGLNIKEDIISPNPIDSTEYRFIEENPKIAWSKINVSQHPSYYTSNFENEITNTGEFFNENMIFNDRTSPYSSTILPDRCYLDQDNQILCNYNNRLQNIPPKLISDSNNKVIESIGQGKGDIFKAVDGKNIEEINGNYYQSWNYDNEKLINGGSFYDGVLPSENSNENYLLLENVDIKKNYAL